MAERDRLGEVLVQAERARGRARDVRHLERVRQANAIVVTLGRQEDLRLVLQPSKRLGMNDPVSIAMKAGAKRIGRLLSFAPLRVDGERGMWREGVALDLLGSLPGGRHAAILARASDTPAEALEARRRRPPGAGGSGRSQELGTYLTAPSGVTTGSEPEPREPPATVGGGATLTRCSPSCPS